MSKLLCVYELKTILLSLKNFNKVKKVEKEVDKYKIRIKNDLYKIKQIVREIQFVSKYEYPQTCMEFMSSVGLLESSNNLNDIDSSLSIEQVNEMIKWILDNKELEILTSVDQNCLKYDNEYIYKNNNSNRNIPIMLLEDFEHELSKANPNRKDAYNVIQNYIIEGDDGKSFKDVFKDGCDLYGIESITHNAARARHKKVYKKIAIGSNWGSKISNEVFDMLLINTAIELEPELNSMGLLKERKESKSIKNSIKYLRKEGLCLFRLPLFRLTKELNLFLSKQLSNVQIVKEYGSSPYVSIIGYKNYTKESKYDIYEYLNNSVNNIKDIPKHVASLTALPTSALEVTWFRGSIIDNEELLEMLDTTNLHKTFIANHNKVDTTEDIQPLLPFNIGQIGLVLTSGCLDGTIEEYDNQYHVVKGKVLKIRTVVTDNEENSNDTKTVETTSNKVQINVFTPDGKYIELT